jgi:hypothetical protein
VRLHAGRDQPVPLILTFCRLRTHPLLIDLTVSDEEDGPQFRRRIHRKRTSPISTARMLWEPLVSNHGLLLPGIFDQEESLPQHRRIIPEPNHAERHQVSKSVQSSVHKDSGRPSPPPSKRDGILRTNTNPVPSQRSAGKPLGRTQTQDQNPSFNSLPDAVKGPKRRKTFHNGTISRDPPISATPTSAPTPLERRIQLLMAAKPVKSSLPSVNIPVANNLVGWPSRLQHGNARSRVSGEGRIQKAKHSSHRDVQLLAEERNERIVQVLRNQVFKHIKTAIRRHHGSLTNTDRTAIGTKVSSEIHSTIGIVIDLV